MREAKWLRASLEEEVDEIKNQWAVGVFTSESVEETAALSAEARGRIIGLFYANDLLTKEEKEDERKSE